LKPKQAVNKTLRFMGLGTTLAASIGLGAIGGKKFDEEFQLEKPLGTALGALFGLAVGLLTVVRNLKSR